MRKLVIGFGLVGLLSACGDPLADFAKIDEVTLQDKPAQVDALATPTSNDDRPLFERLLGKKTAPEEVETAAEDTAEELTAEATDETPEATSTPAEEAPAEADAMPEEAAAAEAPPAEKKTLFGFLKSNPAAAEPEKIAPSADEEADVINASLSDAPEQSPIVSAEKERNATRGLFGARKAARLTGPDAQLIEPGAQLPFGVIARVCKLKRGEMGREVERSSDGKGKFRLYDSAPGNTAPHAFYITGFNDGCPRQVTAALATFGDVARHEFLRYGPATKGQAWSETDKAYEKIKRQVCKVGKGKPCGAKLSKLEKSTSFLTVYSTFVGSSNWRNVLLHDGSVIAMN